MTFKLIAILAMALAPLATHAAEVRDLIKECAYCHGDAGVAKDKDVPHLAGQQSSYLYNQLLAFRSGSGRTRRCAT